MNREPSPDIQEKMRALCGQISVANDLDAEIQRELYDHMEDKLLAYLSGEEPVTEQDAFILVREHFGDPAAIKEYMHETHTVAAGVSIGRRLTAALTVWMPGALISVLVIKSAGLLPLSHSGIGSILQSFFVTAVLLVAQPWVIYRVLKRWQERIERNEPVWFNGMSMWNVALVSAGMATLWMTASYLSDFFPGGIDDGYPMFFVTLSLGGNFIIQVALWFWWCDRPPRVAVDRAIVALLAIMMFCALISVTFDAQSWIAKLYVMVMMIVPALVSILVGLGAYRLALKFWAKEKDTQATSM